MKKIRSVLIDDEAGSRRVMLALIDKYFPVLEVVGEAANVDEAYELIVSLCPQLVFLDIQMPRADGFNLLNRFTQIPFEVIFVTGYNHYAINAIRFNALDYLLKPVEVSDLKNAVEKAVQRIDKNVNNSIQVINLLHSLNAESHERRLSVHAGEKVRMLRVRDIQYVEADRRYCHLFMDQNERYTTVRSLSEFEDYLGEGSSFIRISKSFLLNTDYIKEYSKGDPFIITLKNNMLFEIPRRKKSEILGKLKQ